MELTLEQALQKGVEAHKAGRTEEANLYYDAILKTQPKHPDANHNMGILAVSIGKLETSLPFFKTALEANPSIAQFWLSYIETLVKLDRIDDAKAVFDQAKSKGAKGDRFDKLENCFGLADLSKSNIQEVPREQLNGLIRLYNQQKLQQVFTKAQKLTKCYTKSLALWNLVGTSAAQIGNLNEAVLAFQKALSLKPNDAKACNNMGNALRAQGKLEEAIKSYEKALSIKPDYEEAYYNMGNILQEQGKLKEAIDYYKKALSIKPDYAEAFNNMGNALKEQSYWQEALEAYKTAISVKPDYAEAYNNIGNTLQDHGEIENAIESYNTALAVKPDYAEAYNNMGSAFSGQGKLKEARKAYKKAISLKPDYTEAHRNLSLVKKYTEKDPHFLQVKEYYESNNLNKIVKCNLSFALAKMYEDIGNIGRAFHHLSEGNKLRKKLLRYSIDQDEHLFEQIRAAQPSLKTCAIGVDELPSEIIPIFILGMPRSGTTLVEQIISSHSQVTGAGEINYVRKYGFNLAINSNTINTENINSFRNNYLSEVSKISKGKHFITDKMPLNFQFIPLILSAIPEAKIIHVHRNASATCWSNYKQYFSSTGLAYSYDLKDIVSYYRLYTDLMKVWRSEYSNKIYCLNYETLTTEQEIETKKLFKFLELDWEKVVLSPHENKRYVMTASQRQVRQEVYKGSSKAWRKYEPYLQGAFVSLK